MAQSSLVGAWQLAGVAQTEREATLIGDDSDQADLRLWLNGSDDALCAEAAPASGLLLKIAADGGFTERRTGTPAVPWFDAEGVLAEEVVPFDGVFAMVGHVAYLRPVDIAAWARPVDGRYGPAVLRYDDGDTKIADAIAAAGDRLVRTINVVTDELYLTRVALIYARAG